jgi:acyl-CoA reductase-like NAD-dependent aldehyde dehydrogenase
MLTQIATESEMLVSYNPATEEVVGSVPLTAPESIQSRVDKARAAHVAWAAKSHRERARIMRRFQQIVVRESDSLAELISKENGKPVTEAIVADIMGVVEWIRPLIKMSRQALRGHSIGLGKAVLMGRSSRLEFGPYGVVAIIAPWNYPFSIPAGECLQALLCGNAIVLKPSEITPLTGQKLIDMFHEAGIPADVAQIVHGAGPVGAALIDATPDKIAFTGAVATGKRIGITAAERMIPCQLELGGKAPAIVFADCNLTQTVEAIVWGAFMNSGQTCAAVERCYVERPLYDRFVEAVVAKTKTLRQGEGISPHVEIGPMTRAPERERVDAQVRQALDMGAKALTGGRKPEGKGYFYPPTVLVGVDHRMDCMSRETFGPLLPIMPFDREDEAVALANDSTLGLTASVWTRDGVRAGRVARQIESGTVMINETTYTFGLVQTPWGGRKDSGLGWTHGTLGMHEFVRPQHIHTNHLTILRDPWWFPYTPAVRKRLRLMLRMFGL